MDLKNVKVLIIFLFKVYRQNIKLLYIDRISSNKSRLKAQFQGQNGATDENIYYVLIV